VTGETHTEIRHSHPFWEEGRYYKSFITQLEELS